MPHHPSDNYCIKPGYHPNLTQRTYDAGEDPSYWDAGRLESAGRFQYDVYRLAAEMCQDHGWKRVLDVGSGPPLKLRQLFPSQGMQLHLVDQPNTASQARHLLPQAAFTPANLETVDVDLGQQFDLIICADVIEHLISPEACLEFIKRHLTPHGRLLLSTPERDLLRGPAMDHSPHPMHVREWNQAEFAAFITSRGLTIERHCILPQQRTGALTHFLGRIAHRLGHPPAWYSCQLVICRLATA